MAVFFKNICQFNNCNRNFYTLPDLIRHIEGDHLDFEKAEQLEAEKPESVPLSYVLRFSNPNDNPPKYSPQPEAPYLNQAVINELDDGTTGEVVTPFNNNYLNCDYKEVKEHKVVEARLNKDDFPPLLGGSKLFTLDHSHKKPFACNMRGCEKRYKNVNGIKYHYKKHHKMLIPTLKKSLLKHKPVVKPKHDLHGIPLYSYKPSLPADMGYHPRVQVHHRFEDADDYVYKYALPTSDFPVTQVPLSSNMSFNYYDVGDVEDFSGKNSAYFVTNFDRF